MTSCSHEAWQRLGWVAFISLRLVYVLFFVVACFAFDRISFLLGKVEVCAPGHLRNSTVSGAPCTDMSPLIQGCLMSSVLSFLVIILHTAVELRARGPMRYLCGETAEYGQGFLAMLRLCIVQRQPSEKADHPETPAPCGAAFSKPLALLGAMPRKPLAP